MAISLSINERQNLRPIEITNNKENIQLIWLDENINNSSDCKLTMSKLIELNSTAQFYSDFNRCFDLIKSIKHEQIFLIVSGSFVRNLLSQINNHRSLVAVFIFCTKHQHHESLINEYDKIIGIYTNRKSLLKSIGEQMNLMEKQKLVFNLFDQKQKSIKDLSKESASFLWNQMLIYILKQIPPNEQSKKQMINLCQTYYQNNKNEMKKIELFRKKYKRDKAIEWYTDEGFLYKLLNKALRTEDIELLYTFRFFIIDLCEEIEKESQHSKDKNILTLYRGTQIPKEELEKLKYSMGQIISTNGFLSTSRNINISLQFARSNHLNNDFKGVLFEIHADPSLKSISFADIKNKSQIKTEEEVLFNLNSLFKIHAVYFDRIFKIWKIQLNTTDEGSEKVDEYLTFVKRNMEEYSPIIYFGRLLLYELNQIDRAEKYFEMLLKSLSPEHSDIASIYNNMGNVHFQRLEFNLALKNYEKSYEIRRKRLPFDHPHIAGSLNNIGLIHRTKGNYDLALDYYQKALKIKEKISSDDNLQKAIMNENIGLVYTAKNDINTALDYLNDALEMYKRILPDQHPDIARCLGNIGYVYEKKGDLEVALNYYQQQLKMQEQCLPFDHPILSFTLDSIIRGYETMDKLELGLDFCQERILEQKNRLGENHPSIARTLMIMGWAIGSNNLNESLLYYEEALSILENCIPSDHQAIAKCLKDMACIYGDLKMLEDALQCLLKALDFNRQRLTSDHIEIGINLSFIGFGYEQLKNPSEALRYYNESLSIYRANFGPDHYTVKRMEEIIEKLNIS